MVDISNKRREWIDNLEELKKKKEKELEELEEKKKKELKEAEELLSAGEDALTDEEEQIIQKLREHIPELKEISENKAKKEEKESINLEETVAREQIDETVVQRAGPIYETPIEEKITAIYQASNYNIYNDLKATFEKVQRGEYLSSQERSIFYKRQEQIERLSANKELIDSKDSFGYVDRSKQVIDSIQQTLGSKGTYKKGDHI